MVEPQKDRRFILVTFLSLLALFVIALFQNYLRYGHSDHYDIWRSVVYLLVSVVLFLPVVSLSLIGLRKIIQKRKTRYWPLAIGISLAGMAIFFLVSNSLLHFFGYFDHFIDERYARYYFGREALFHLLVMGATITYVHFSKARQVLIEVNDGRKTLQILLDGIEWIEADDHYMQIHTDSGSFIKRSNMADMAKELQPDFVRIHRKYLVNRKKISGKERNQRDEYVILNSGMKLKVGRSFTPVQW